MFSQLRTNCRLVSLVREDSLGKQTEQCQLCLQKILPLTLSRFFDDGTAPFSLISLFTKRPVSCSVFTRSFVPSASWNTWGAQILHFVQHNILLRGSTSFLFAKSRYEVSFISQCQDISFDLLRKYLAEHYQSVNEM